SEAKGRALGISGIGATVGLVVGPFLGGAICEAAGWRVTFFVFSAITILTGLAFYFFAVEPRREIIADKQFKANGGAGGWNRGLIFFLVAAAAIFTFREFAGWGGYYVISIFTETIYKYPAQTAGFISGMQSFGGFIAQPLGGWLSDRIGRRRLMSALLFFAALFMVAIPFAGQRPLVLLVALYGFAYTATVPIIDALIADRTPSHIRGSVFGIFMAAGIGISSLSPLLQAKILDATGSSLHSFKICYIILAASLLVSMTLMLLFKNAEKKA
ncbi:MAG: MFS transporter, partial [bacterium]